MGQQRSSHPERISKLIVRDWLTSSWIDPAVIAAEACSVLIALIRTRCPFTYFKSFRFLFSYTGQNGRPEISGLRIADILGRAAFIRSLRVNRNLSGCRGYFQVIQEILGLITFSKMQDKRLPHKGFYVNPSGWFHSVLFLRFCLPSIRSGVRLSSPAPF